MKVDKKVSDGSYFSGWVKVMYMVLIALIPLAMIAVAIVLLAAVILSFGWEGGVLKYTLWLILSTMALVALSIFTAKTLRHGRRLSDLAMVVLLVWVVAPFACLWVFAVMPSLLASHGVSVADRMTMPAIDVIKIFLLGAIFSTLCDAYLLLSKRVEKRFWLDG